MENFDLNNRLWLSCSAISKLSFSKIKVAIWIPHNIHAKWSPRGCKKSWRFLESVISNSTDFFIFFILGFRLPEHQSAFDGFMYTNLKYLYSYYIHIYWPNTRTFINFSITVTFNLLFAAFYHFFFFFDK